MSAVIGLSTLERARNVAYWRPGTTVTDLVEHGLDAEVATLEAVEIVLFDPETGRSFTKPAGEPFPPRRGPLAAGPRTRR